MTHRFAALGALLALLAMPVAARADTVVLTDWTSAGVFALNATNGGGAFRAATTGTLLGNTSFMTFCLEFNEHFSYGAQYNFTLSGAAVAGGGGSVYDPNTGNTSDPLSDATKWIYYQAITGGFAFIQAFGSDAYVGARVQEAIWYLEGERTASQIGATSVALADYAVVNQNWGALYTQGHRVSAMNLTDAAGNRVQDQLAYSSIPEASSLLLLGGGLIVIGLLVRRRLR